MMKAVIGLALVAAALAQLPAGGENFGIPIATSPIPHDKCSVAGANDADHRLTVFTWGYDNAFWYAKQDENWGWSKNVEWKSAKGFFVSGPTVIRNADNDLVVFGRGVDRKIMYQVFHRGEETGWLPLGGKLLYGRPTATLDPQGLIHLFARGKDGAAWEKRQYANGTEAVWGEWTSLGGIVTSNIAAIVDAEGVHHLFARGTEGALWSMTQKLEDDGSLTWVAWEKSENSVVLSSSATIVAKLNAANLIEVVVRGADKSYWHTRQTLNDNRGVVWSPWKSLGGIFASPASLAINSDQLLTVFGRGPEKGVWYKQQAHHPVDSPSDSWSKWVPLGGRFSAAVDIIPDSRGYLNIFGRGLEKGIWSRGQMFANKTVGFFGPWKELSGRFRQFAC